MFELRYGRIIFIIEIDTLRMRLSCRNTSHHLINEIDDVEKLIEVLVEDTVGHKVGVAMLRTHPGEDAMN